VRWTVGGEIENDGNGCRKVGRMNGYYRMSPGIKWLIIANTAVFVLQALFPYLGYMLVRYGSLFPAQIVLSLQVWRLGPYMFLHGNMTHLLFNMLALWMFGVELEGMWGTRRFIQFYFLAGIGSALFSFVMFTSNIIGASGAVLAILTVYAIYFPNRIVYLFFMFPVPVRVAVLLFGGISVLFAIQGGGGNIAHITHLGGILVGFLYMKGYDKINYLIEHFRDLARQRAQRMRNEHSRQRDRHFETVIDPILKKISQQGMDSLTQRERSILKNASTVEKEKMKKRNIVPFDLFR